MRAFEESLAQWLRRGETVAIATVVETKRSAPLPVGSKLALNGRGEVIGAVSGGCVEGAVVEVAERVLHGAPPQLVHYGVGDGEGDVSSWDIGLPCGGEITIWVERYRARGSQERFFDAVLRGQRAAVVTALERVPQRGAKLLLGADGSQSGTLGARALNGVALAQAREALWSERCGLYEAPGGALLFVDVVAPPPRLIIIGALDFAAQLAEVARLVGWRPFVADPRARFTSPARFPAAEQVVIAWPQQALAQLAPIDRSTAIAILTHDPKLDDAAIQAALASEASYIGAMGSRLAHERRAARLLEAGIDPVALSRIAAPIGLDIGARSPAETALSIMSEIVATRRGRTGGRLSSAAAGRIHDVALA